MHLLKKTVPDGVIRVLTVTYLVGALLVFNQYRFIETKDEVLDLKIAIHTLQNDLRETNQKLAVARSETVSLVSLIVGEQEKNSTLAEQVRSVVGTVGTLEKLSKTDKELLKKYSKVYFLNENYIPINLVKIDGKYLSNPDIPMEFHANAYPYLVSMFEAALRDGITLKIVSAYRSFGTQTALKAAYKVTYGAGTANQFSADQGYSEHQLGTTLDITTPEINGTSTKFETTTAYTWLSANAFRFGFTLSYPKGNAYYQYEPWHWRFVGASLATRLKNDGKYFYDLEQRVIDEYLIRIFD